MYRFYFCLKSTNASYLISWWELHFNIMCNITATVPCDIVIYIFNYFAQSFRYTRENWDFEWFRLFYNVSQFFWRLYNIVQTTKTVWRFPKTFQFANGNNINFIRSKVCCYLLQSLKIIITIIKIYFYVYFVLWHRLNVHSYYNIRLKQRTVVFQF